MEGEPTNGTVLVVEDSASVRRLIEVSLRSMNVDIFAAEDGASGLEMIEKHRPDVVVLDIGLPGLDGWEVLRRLRSNPMLGDTPVIILTAHAQPEMAARAEEGGADAFMTKPFRPNELRNEIDRLLKKAAPPAPADEGMTPNE